MGIGVQGPTHYPVRRYEELRPDELAGIVRERPVAYWPLGLLEHHGWHLPIGFDGIKSQRLCERMVERTGGVLLPVMWWGAQGGHGPFLWTHYQPAGAFSQIAETTVRQLIRFGFRAVDTLRSQCRRSRHRHRAIRATGSQGRRKRQATGQADPNEPVQRTADLARPGPPAIG